MKRQQKTLAKGRNKAPAIPIRRVSVREWMGAALAIALASFLVWRNRPHPQGTALTPTNIDAAPMVFAVAETTPANQPPSAPPQAAPSTNSPLQDPNFKIPDDPVQL